MKTQKKINIRSFIEFFKYNSIGGFLLFMSVIISLIIANTFLGPAFEKLLQQQWGFSNTAVHLNYTLRQWINDGLMAVFFLLVGLEIKREIIEGELSSFKKAAMPVIAAFGGAILPAAIFYCLNYNMPTSRGWGIPMATDIAFALAVISLLNKRLPPSLKIFLAALAIADDLIAIIVIAIFYSDGIHLINLLLAALVFIILVICNRLKVKNYWCYIIPGLFLWYFIHHSGIHATIAGVLVALTLPTTTSDVESPLEKLEHLLTKPVNYFILPLFALANTNIQLQGSMLMGLTSPVSLGIILGLFLGKTIGILLTVWGSIKLKIGQLPEHANWQHLLGIGLLAGIGFTMSIFITMLSFSDEYLILQSKFAVLIVSVIAGVAGFTVLASSKRK